MLPTCAIYWVAAPEVVDLPTVKLSQRQPCTHVQLPSGKLLRYDALALSACCEALKKYELVDHTVVLSYPDGCGLQDDDVALFFDWLYKFQWFGGCCPDKEWEPQWFYLVAALECSPLYSSARGFLQRTLHRSGVVNTYPFWEWLSVSRHSFLQFGKARRRLLQNLKTREVKQLLAEYNMKRVARYMPLEDCVDLAIIALSGEHRRTFTIRHNDFPDIVIPSFSDMKAVYIAELVEKKWGVSRDEFDWSQYGDSESDRDSESYCDSESNFICSPDGGIFLLERKANDEGNKSPQDQAVFTEAPTALAPRVTAAHDLEASTVVCDGVPTIAESLHVVLEVGELKIVCSRDHLRAIGRLTCEMIDDLNDEAATMAEIPLPGLLQYAAADVIEFFQRLHNRTLCEKDSSGKRYVHWRLSWVHIASYLQTEPLFEAAAEHISNMFSSGKCCASLDLFRDCIEASRLPAIRSKHAAEWYDTTTAEGLRQFLLDLPPFRLGMMLYENNRNEVARQFEKIFDEHTRAGFAYFIADAAQWYRCSNSSSR